MVRGVRFTLFFGLVALLGCGAAASSTPGGAAGDADACATAPACASAISAAANAEDGARVAALVTAFADRHQGGWDEVFKALGSDRGAALVLGDTVALPPAREDVDRDALILALGRARGRAHVFVAVPSPRLFFPDDDLGRLADLVPAIIAVDPEQRAADQRLATGITRA
ncbi:MAG: hypothetical protein AAF928_18975, partial [Myxococcota bacterium]